MFSLFHDFEIIDLKWQGANLDLLLEIPWGELWDELDYKITVRLFNVSNLFYEYWSLISNEEVSNKPGSSAIPDKLSGALSELPGLNLSIQSHTLELPNNFTFYCQSNNGQIEAEIHFTTTGYTIFDKNQTEISLNAMEDWAKLWVESIQKMWDGQKHNEDNAAT